MGTDTPTDASCSEFSMVAGTAIDYDYVFIAGYPDIYKDYWDELEYTRLYSVDLSNRVAPWMTRDIRQKIVSLCVWRDYPGPTRLYVSMTLNGEVTMVGSGGKPMISEYIPGAGIGKPWSNDLGYMNSIQCIGGSLYACGADRQVFRRQPNLAWEMISDAIMSSPDRLSHDVIINTRSLSCIAGQAEDSIYCCGLFGDLFFYSGTEWTQINTSNDSNLLDMDASSADCVYIVGSQGTFLRGTALDGFEAIRTGNYYLTGVAQFQGLVYISYGNGILCYDVQTGRLFHCKTNLEPDVTDSFRVESINGVLWSFGEKDLAFYNGSKWSRVLNPDNALISRRAR